MWKYSIAEVNFLIRHSEIQKHFRSSLHDNYILCIKLFVHGQLRCDEIASSLLKKTFLRFRSNYDFPYVDLSMRSMHPDLSQYPNS